jgi:peptide deformylase
MFGLEARIFQHEYDHMEGTNFTKRVSKLKVDMAKKRAIKQLKKSIRLAS